MVPNHSHNTTGFSATYASWNRYKEFDIIALIVLSNNLSIYVNPVYRIRVDSRHPCTKRTTDLNPSVLRLSIPIMTSTKT
uniref:Uncharacterized protein n=1 Tax=Ciona savignyi TaxID=51511 RepID=H2Y8S3_CIOSA